MQFKVGQIYKSSKNISYKVLSVLPNDLIVIKRTDGDANSQITYTSSALSLLCQVYDFKLQEKTNDCVHEFKSYVGFNDSFSYCIHCDTKISVNEQLEKKVV